MSCGGRLCYRRFLLTSIFPLNVRSTSKASHGSRKQTGVEGGPPRSHSVEHVGGLCGRGVNPLRLSVRVSSEAAEGGPAHEVGLKLPATRCTYDYFASMAPITAWLPLWRR